MNFNFIINYTGGGGNGGGGGRGVDALHWNFFSLRHKPSSVFPWKCCQKMPTFHWDLIKTLRRREEKGKVGVLRRRENHLQLFMNTRRVHYALKLLKGI